MLLVTNMISHLGFQRRLQHLLHQPSQQTALASERHLVMSGLLGQPFSDQRQRRVRRQHQICRDLLDLIVFILHFMILPEPRQFVADRSQITERLHTEIHSPRPGPCYTKPGTPPCGRHIRHHGVGHIASVPIRRRPTNPTDSKAQSTPSTTNQSPDAATR